MTTEMLYDEDLPSDARVLIDAADAAVEKLRAKGEADVARIRAKADRDVAAVEQRTQAAVRERLAELSQVLKPLQDAYAGEGKLDEALAIRARIRASRSGGQPVEPAPEILTVKPSDVGKSFLFDVTGTIHGPLWGTDVYTSDSSLAKAVVHAGILKKGERGVVKVTALDTSEREGFQGSRRNGVTSLDWDEWDFGFQVALP